MVLLFVSPLLLAQTRTETGTLGGAQFKIEIPANWNHGLVLYCHGYSMKMGLEENPAADLFLQAGYAVAQSAYSASGWAIAEGSADSEALRQYFAQKYGAPTETIVSGDSMGGLITVMLMETHPQDYSAGLAVCGALDDTLDMMQKHVFDVRVVFDYWYPGTLADLGKLPPPQPISKTEIAKLLLTLNTKPRASAYLQRITGATNSLELAETMAFWTYILEDLQQRGNGNAFDNRNTIYTGSPDDVGLNKGVKRYVADPQAVAYLKKYYSPTGELGAPLLALHTLHDQIVQAFVPDNYNLQVERAGKESFFVQQVVNETGHCHFKPEELTAAFADLQKWKATGVRPPAGMR